MTCSRKPNYFLFTISYLKGETEYNPLIIFDISSLIGVNGFVNSGMRNIDWDSLPEGARNCVGRMNPAIGIENALWNIMWVNTVDGVTEELPRCHEDGGGDHERYRKFVAESENGGVNFDPLELEDALETWEWPQHFESQKWKQFWVSKIFLFFCNGHRRLSCQAKL